MSPCRRGGNAARARHALVLLAAACLAFPACATRLQTSVLTAPVPDGGYRFDPCATGPDNSNDLCVAVAFSGGGTRASALSFGVLEELARTPVRRAHAPGTVQLLDEVDVLSGVSGGAFPAAAYGAFGDGVFRDLPRAMLFADLDDVLLRTLLAPWEWPRIASPTFDRIDLAAEVYDEILFRGRTFGDVRRRAPRPFVLVNAANMTTGTVFPFTQDAFDVLGADLDRYPLSRAVAASSAVPGIFSPVTLRNHPAAPGLVLPRWVQDGLGSKDARERRAARALAVYHLDQAAHPFVHLLDGGLADNTGLRPILEGLRWGFLRDLLDGRPAPDGRRPEPVRTLLVIVVNARGAPDVDLDRDEVSPGATDALVRTVSWGVDNATFETIEETREALEERGRRAARGEVPPLATYFVEVALRDLPDPDLRSRLQHVPTRFTIPRADAALLIRAGADLLRSNGTFRRFLAEHDGAVPVAPEPPTAAPPPAAPLPAAAPEDGRASAGLPPPRVTVLPPPPR